MRALLLLALLAAPALAAEVEEPRASADRLVAALVERGPAAFLDAIVEDTAIGADAFQRREIAESRLRRVRELESLGVIVDSEYAGARHFAPSLRTLCYIVRYRRQPLLMAFRYYQGGRGWDLVNYAYAPHAGLQNWECAAAAPLVAP
ncbi:hypothetical protein ACE7GA_23165 [Roseomonas sp. CCTCC AB2023176]|uniref:hypothetical protein n=1 Tax=Roseomonas sp. CCTCC AB2023176 TaxID=3342640 RepID=UPI0035D566A3